VQIFACVNGEVRRAGDGLQGPQRGPDSVKAAGPRVKSPGSKRLSSSRTPTPACAARREQSKNRNINAGGVESFRSPHLVSCLHSMLTPSAVAPFRIVTSLLAVDS
jgi:hypothetical protein